MNFFIKYSNVTAVVEFHVATSKNARFYIHRKRAKFVDTYGQTDKYICVLLYLLIYLDVRRSINWTYIFFQKFLSVRNFLRIFVLFLIFYARGLYLTQINASR